MKESMIYQQLPSLLGTTVLSSGALCKPTDLNINDEEYRIDSFWISEMRHMSLYSPIVYPFKIRDSYEYLTIVSMYGQDKKYRLYVFVPNLEDNDQIISFFYKADNWDDIVGRTMQAMDLFPSNNFWAGGHIIYNFKMSFNVRNLLSGNFSTDGQSFGTLNLFECLLISLYRFIKYSDNDELKEFINYQQLENCITYQIRDR